MSAPTTVPFVRAAGDPYTVGRTHGAALGPGLRAFLGDSLARLNKVLPEPVTLDGLRPVIAAHRAEITAALPALAEEVAGLAAGAGITEEEAWLLQVRREIMGYRKVPTAGDCTTWAVAGSDPAGPALAQTVDLNGDLDEVISVLEVSRADVPRRSLVLSFGGLLGYLGINSDGLAVGLNLVLGGDWKPGVPPYLAIRHLLDTAGSVEEALKVLAGLPLASSRSLTLCDRERAVWLEVLGDELRVHEARRTVHTNHFLHPDFVAADEINVFARNSSVRRLKAATEGLAGLTAGAGPEEHFAVLSRPPIRVPDRGDVRAERTVAAVVLLPAEGRLHLRPGDPALSGTQVFTL
ncbi:peptidase C45 [Streptomyces sp. WAC05374]|uniref:C45 family autoproteolytic acyltransferase/hydolase n=1 Tax=Streptomyces sp. WAC05374 TaxID=2487420 RepID=UPI000F88CC98|nr:C45 family peptidase [Streptomyces sp. WAC05374]RST19077.1 peptidase C45 [Streptomyces sp. WAC05374]TDF36955.1 peptidase C45 [Streptomyces sp. WAC05374]TDF46450.1 peptidase C45 [Streptomyces sp. WAC05374]TDF47551.1 peptidase C45 [Streptomyces sp. WAC05374]